MLNLRTDIIRIKIIYMKILSRGRFILFFAILIVSCGRNRDIKIGFVSDLSGRNSGLGISARNGVKMAIDEINHRGGINGDEVILISKDHKSNVTICQEVVEELLSDEVDVIIGPLMSSMAQTVINTTKGKDVLIISPTVSSDILSGLDDNFFRVIAPASAQGTVLAKIMENKKIAIIQDSRNTLYSQSVSDQIEKTLPDFNFEKINFKDKSDFPEVLNQLKHYKPESIVFICSGIDAASIIQQYNKNIGPLPKLYGSSWVKQSDILSYGGKTVEGMIVVDSFSLPVKSEKEKKFFYDYNARFGYDPNLSAIYSYESVKMFETGAKLSRSFNFFDVKSALIAKRDFIGVADNYELDVNGDVKREFSLYKIINNQFVLFLNGSE